MITARASTPETNGLEVVLLEKDSAPWGAVIPLTEGWREIVVPLDDFRFFSHWQHPSGRGGRGDRFHPENVQAVNFCFGAWLFGNRAAQPHGIEVQSVTLVTGH